MSDITLDITWFDLLVFSPFLGWPGLFVGAVLGGIGWRKRPILGAVLGAVAGNFIVFAVRLFLR